MAAKFSFQRLGDVLLVLSASLVPVMIFWAGAVGRFLIILAHVFLYIGLVCVLIDSVQKRVFPGTRLLAAFAIFFLLVCVGPVVVAAA